VVTEERYINDVCKEMKVGEFIIVPTPDAEIYYVKSDDKILFFKKLKND